MNILNIMVHDKIVKGVIRLPASKSISNRVLIIRQLVGKEMEINNLAEADDTQLMHTLLNSVKNNKLSNTPISLQCENAGTVFRFLTALLSLTPGKWELRGSKRMTQRPVGPLVEALIKLGAKIEYLGQAGYPPLMIEGNPLKGGHITVDGSVSSQFISALIMIGPVLPGGLKLTLKNKINSLPYIQMTLGLLENFGITVIFENNEIIIPEKPYALSDVSIEPDWSSAAFWFELAAFSKTADILFPGLTRESMQGDAILPDIFKSLGLKTQLVGEGIRIEKSGIAVEKFIFNFSNNPDLALPVIVTCAGLKIKGMFTGLENLQYKETNRLSALVNELTGLGYPVEIMSNGDVKIIGEALVKKMPTSPGPVKTYSDHRMAMAFAPLAMMNGNIKIEDPEVVSKSYPGFWEDFKKITSSTINIQSEI